MAGLPVPVRRRVTGRCARTASHHAVSETGDLVELLLRTEGPAPDCCSPLPTGFSSLRLNLLGDPCSQFGLPQTGVENEGPDCDLAARSGLVRLGLTDDGQLQVRPRDRPGGSRASDPFVITESTPRASAASRLSASSSVKGAIVRSAALASATNSASIGPLRRHLVVSRRSATAATAEPVQELEREVRGRDTRVERRGPRSRLSGLKFWTVIRLDGMPDASSCL